jgi:hypothetical protein
MDLKTLRIMFLTALLFTAAGVANAQQDTTAFVSAFEEQNDKCFSCHGQSKYKYENEVLGTTVTDMMGENRVVRKDEFYRSNHKSFACIDCHAAGYEIFPHPGELRMEQMYGCLDCHSGEVTFAQYQFEKIDTEYRASVHVKLEDEGFTCWSCHNPHTYRITARTRNLGEIVAYDNAICLNCHSDFNRFQLLTEREEINIISKHDWLPNQRLHFGSVRCIECHAVLSDTLLVSHHIKPKEEAVKQCNECHSRNSLLMASLYRYESKERRSDGFFNGVIMNESFVIGANRNEFLNYISLGVFLLVIVAVGFHIFLRITRRRKLNEH